MRPWMILILGTLALSVGCQPKSSLPLTVTPPSSPSSTPTPNGTSSPTNPTRLVSYNGVSDTFERTHILELKNRGLTGQGVIIRFRDETDPNLDVPLLRHTILPGRTILHGSSRSSHHALGMALIAAGSLDPSTYRVGAAPGVKIATGDGCGDGDLAVIQSDSINSTNLIFSSEYIAPYDSNLDPRRGDPQFNGDQILPPENPPQRIHVTIAGNGGSHTDTNVGFGIRDGHEPFWGNLIVTVAVDPANRLTRTSSRCGNTHRFCIGVPSQGTTSETAPIVTGTLALLMEARPGRALREYVRAILETTTPLPNVRETGRGLLNAEAAYQYIMALP